MNRLTAILSTFGMLVLITACGSVPPAPTDRFYRLQPVQISSMKPACASCASITITFGCIHRLNWCARISWPAWAVH